MRDTLRLAVSSDFPGWNPLVSDNASLAVYAPLVHGYLLRVDAQGRFVPDLALAVPSVRNGGISADGLRYRYRLRRGVHWQDGAPFDARDVVFSFRAVSNPRNDVPDRSGFDQIRSVMALDPYTVAVRLRRPYSPGVATFFTPGANDPYPILPAHLLAALPDLNAIPYNGAPVGLGPYRLTRWNRGSRVVFTADPHYFRGPPHIPRIEVQIVPDSQTVGTLWRTGAIDAYLLAGFSASRVALDVAKTVPDATFTLFDHYQFNYEMFNVTRGPLRERAVREAIVRGIDRDGIMRAVSGNFYRPGSGDRLPGQFAYEPALVQPPYDLVRARALLERAGWRMRDGVRQRDGVPLSLEMVGVTGAAAANRFDVQLQAQLTRLGIRTTIKNYQYPLLFEPFAAGGIYATGKFDLAYYGWQPGEDDDHSYLFRCDSRPPAGENYSGICDPAIDRAAARELAATDPAVRADADRAILRRLDAQSDMLFLGFNREALFVKHGVTGIGPSVLGIVPWNAWEWRFTS